MHYRHLLLIQKDTQEQDFEFIARYTLDDFVEKGKIDYYDIIKYIEGDELIDQLEHSLKVQHDEFNFALKTLKESFNENDGWENVINTIYKTDNNIAKSWDFNYYFNKLSNLATGEWDYDSYVLDYENCSGKITDTRLSEIKENISNYIGVYFDFHI